MDVIVVGAGVFGAWTAHYLAAAGARVMLIDAYGPGHSRSSSGDESRILRCGYGTDEIYSRFARRSREAWELLDWRLGCNPPLWHACGVLWLAVGEHAAYTAETLHTLQTGGYLVETLDQHALSSRYPCLVADDVAAALIEPDGGVVMARRSVQTLVTELTRQGVVVDRGRVIQPAPGHIAALRLSDGTELRGEQFVFACGAWLPAIFPELLEHRIKSTRQAVMYFGTPPGDDRYSSPHMPAWIDFGSGIYGIPDLEGRGLKVGIDSHGAAFDPDHGDRTIDRDSVERARGWLRRRLPALADAPLVESRVCQYENTWNGDFLIDRHPDHDNAWIVGGGSGHGFKHGPAVGEYAAGLIAGEVTAEPRFALAGKGTESRRAVY